MSRPRWAMPITTSLGAVLGGEADRLVEHRDGHVQALDRELLLAEVGLVQEALERVDLGQAPEQLAPLVGVERARGTRRTRCARAATRAGGATRCARSRRRSCRSRSRAGAAARRRACRRARRRAGCARGSALISSGVRPTVVGIERRVAAGRATPSGSRRAPRWPWVRCALTSEVAACTAWSSSSSTAPGAAAGAAAARGGARRAGGGRLGRRADRRRRGPRRRARRSSSSPWSRASMRWRKRPDSAPWMIRWS